MTINCKGKLVSAARPLVMGILNITDNSFYDGGMYLNETDYLLRTEKMLEDGADIIDIGCMATNPYATELEETAELSVVEKAVKQLIKRFPDTLFSIDTWRASVAELAVNNGVAIINDISGGDFDAEMFAAVARLQVPYILMHTSDRPHLMSQNTNYADMLNDIFLYLSRKVEQLHLLGVNDVILDCGFGFGKTVEQNYELLKHLSIFKQLNLPVLVGISRKRMLYNLLNITAEQALNATTVVNTIALLNGADILRVHDVREAVEAVKIVETYKQL